VLKWIDLTGLLLPGSVTDNEAVLNGIAYDAAHDRLFVTGKLWPKIFEIKLVPEVGPVPVKPRHKPARHGK
jgi:glutamine cyclotransferase